MTLAAADRAVLNQPRVPSITLLLLSRVACPLAFATPVVTVIVPRLPPLCSLLLLLPSALAVGRELHAPTYR